MYQPDKHGTAYQRDLQRRKTARSAPPPLAPTPRAQRRAPVPAQVVHAPAAPLPLLPSDIVPELGHLPGERPFPIWVSDTGRPEGMFDEAGKVPWAEVDDEADYEEGSGA